MERFYLLKYGELSLKGDNRGIFERRLLADIRTKLHGLDFHLNRKHGRIYLQTDESNSKIVENALSATFGLVAFSPALKVNKEMSEIVSAAEELAGQMLKECGQEIVTFKVEVRRTDKGFPFDSYGIACRLGNHLRETFPQFQVKLSNPNWTLNVEIRESAYLYGPALPAPRGLPLGSSGRGLLLLSGGIDSPVAGYLMAKRGLALDAVYFDTPPYTSQQARDKVERLTNILSHYVTGIRLYVVPFTAIQLKIKERAKTEELTLMMRVSMVQIAEQVARRCGAVCLITGESLGQVASQTAESIRFTGSMASLPIFRPLIGYDKEDITILARKINTYETSILPFEDCCTLFAPPRPVVRPNLQRSLQSFRRLEMTEQVQEAAKNASTADI